MPEEPSADVVTPPPWFQPIRRNPRLHVGTLDADGVLALLRLVMTTGFVPAQDHVIHVRMHRDGSLGVEVPWSVSTEDGSFEQLMCQPANALSSSCVFENAWQDRLWRADWARGVLTAPISVVGTSDPVLRIRFKPDHEVFHHALPSREAVIALLEELAVRHPGMTAQLDDDVTLQFPRGAADLLLHRFGRDAFFPPSEPLMITLPSLTAAIMWMHDDDEESVVHGPDGAELGIRRGVALVARTLGALQGVTSDGMRGIRVVIVAEEAAPAEVGRHVTIALMEQLMRFPDEGKRWLTHQLRA